MHRFEKSNQTLSYCNELSKQYYSRLSKDFRSNTSKLNEMFKDIDLVFHRIRVLKEKLHQKHPNSLSKETDTMSKTNDDELMK